MDLIIYFFTGFFVTVLGATPPGAVNLSVVYTTLNKGAKQATPIILSAAVGEIILSLFALHYAMEVEKYIQKSITVQYTIALLLMITGMILFFKKNTQKSIPK